MLQAIALVLSLATRQIADINSFHWNGFVPANIALFSSTKIKLELEMEKDESVATNELIEKLNTVVLKDSETIEPVEQSKKITLVYQEGHLNCLEGLNTLRQLQGRFYFKTLLKNTQADMPQYLSRLGDVFWFDQYRNLGNTFPDNFATPSWINGIASMRDALSRWWVYYKLDEEDKQGTDYLFEFKKKLAYCFSRNSICRCQTD